MLDADGSTGPGEIPAFVDALIAGADFAKGSRFSSRAVGTDDMPSTEPSSVTQALCFSAPVIWRHLLGPVLWL